MSMSLTEAVQEAKKWTPLLNALGGLQDALKAAEGIDHARSEAERAVKAAQAESAAVKADLDRARGEAMGALEQIGKELEISKEAVKKAKATASAVLADAKTEAEAIKDKARADAGRLEADALMAAKAHQKREADARAAADKATQAASEAMGELNAIKAEIAALRSRMASV